MEAELFSKFAELGGAPAQLVVLLWVLRESIKTRRLVADLATRLMFVERHLFNGMPSPGESGYRPNPR